MKPERILIEHEDDGNSILITTYKDYVNKVEKLTANCVRIVFERNAK